MTQSILTDFNAGSPQGWKTAFNEVGETVSVSTAQVYEGADALAVVKTVPAGGAYFTARIDRPNPGSGDPAGDVLDARIYLAPSSPSAGGWSARFWYGDAAFNVIAVESWTPLTPGSWVLVTSDLSTLPIPSDYDSLGIEIQHDSPATGTVTFYMDQVRRGDGTGGGVTPPTIPVIANVAATPGPTQLTITWTTDVPATSQVNYGPTSGYGSVTTQDTTLVTSHSVTIGGLANATTYHYKPVSTNTAGTSTYSTDRSATTGAAPAAASVRFMVNWVDWMQGQAVPWSSMTHMLLFSAGVNANGSLAHNWDAGTRASMVAAAHANGKKIIFVVGGAGRSDSADSAMSSGTRATFVNNLAAMCSSEGFDGIDLDLEASYSASNYVAFIRALRVAVGGTKEIFATHDWSTDPNTYIAAQADLTAMTLMTFGMQGTSGDGWKYSTHHSAIDNPTLIGSDGRPMPSTRRAVDDYIAAGWAPAKLNIAAAWFGKRYNGRTAPGQLLTSGNGATGDEIDYADFKGTEQPNGTYHDDPNWGPWIQESGNFVSIDDENSTPRKYDFCAARGLSGCVVWYGQAVRAPYTAPFTAMAAKLAATPPADTTPPVISNVQIPTATLTASGATITWQTDEAATYVLDYGPTSAYGLKVQDATRRTAQSAALTGLAGNTVYSYRITATDAAGNSSTRAGTFTTPGTVVTPPSAPVITNIQAPANLLTTGGATITWATDVASDSTVEYGTGTAYGQTVNLPAQVTAHSVALTGLTAATAYHYRVRSKLATGQETISADRTFTTASPSVPTPGALPASLSPASKSAGSAGFTLTVTGSGFTPNSVVLWNGASRATTYISTTQVRAVILASDVATPGTAQITIQG